jgi:hypothetical protein
MNTAQKIATSCLLVIALVVIPLTGCPKPAAPEIDKWGAIDILVSEIIPPAANVSRISAFMPSQPLVKGDVVTSEDGNDYPIDQNTWFVFIDDNPQAYYAHATRYVFINAKTGSYDISSQSWPPMINGFSMWDTASVGRGNLIELWSVLGYPGPIAGSTSSAPKADYGDAPDGQDAYKGVMGHFPTLYNTTNSHLGRLGGHTLNTGQETLGFNVSTEVDANDPSDPDGTANLVNADSDERIYIIMDQSQARLAFTVAVSADAPNMTRYANALIDFDQSGNWSSGSAGAEWVAVNLSVDVAPGSSETIMTDLFNWGNQTPLVWAVWMRLALTRDKIEESQFANLGGWDGSGRFNYGEIEDYCGFLTDNPSPPPPPPPPLPPPPKGDGNGGGNGGPPPPGPAKGPCGYDINYHVLIINCGDCAKHIAQGTPIAKSAASTMAGSAQSQGYTSAGNLGPGNNSLAKISQAFADLASSVKCGDYVLIYICGHGKKTGGGGIQIYNSSGGRTNEMLKPGDLSNLLAKIPPCPNEDCETPGKCCNVSVVIESCYAGNFNLPGVTGQGRAVVGTSNDTPSQGVYPGGGVYTAGLAKDMQDPDADQNDPPDGVDPMEANISANEAVSKNNKQSGKSQQPWSSNQWCDCKCPCKPGIDVEKRAWDEMGEDWADEIEVWPDETVTFRLDILSSGKCRDIVGLDIVDTLPDCLEYAGEAVLYVDDQAYDREPGDISQGDGGLTLTWNLMEIDTLAPGESVAIEYEAIARELGENENLVYGSAHCSEDYSVIVDDQDAASVWVTMPQAQDVLQTHLEGYSHCYYYDEPGLVCRYCEVTIKFYAEDLTGGRLPITNLVLSINGEPLVNLQDISQVHLEDTIYAEAGCGQDVIVELMVTNSLGQEQYKGIFGNTSEGELQ